MIFGSDAATRGLGDEGLGEGLGVRFFDFGYRFCSLGPTPYPAKGPKKAR